MLLFRCFKYFSLRWAFFGVNIFCIYADINLEFNNNLNAPMSINSDYISEEIVLYDKRFVYFRVEHVS